MKFRLRMEWAVACAALLLGCSTVSPAPATTPPPPATVILSSDPVEEALGRPDLLLQRAEAHRAATRYDLAYRYYALVHQLHPKSKEDRDAFVWAARLGKRKAEVNLFPDRNSIWVGPERAFLYQWFEEIVRDDFSKVHADALLVDATYELARHFLAYAKTRPALARWQIEVDEDNGRVYAVRWSEAKSAKKGDRSSK